MSTIVHRKDGFFSHTESSTASALKGADVNISKERTIILWHSSNLYRTTTLRNRFILYFSGVCGNMTLVSGLAQGSCVRSCYRREHGHPQYCVREGCQHDWEHESRKAGRDSFHSRRDGEKNNSRAPREYQTHCRLQKPLASNEMVQGKGNYRRRLTAPQ